MIHWFINWGEQGSILCIVKGNVLCEDICILLVVYTCYILIFEGDNLFYVLTIKSLFCVSRKEGINWRGGWFGVIGAPIGYLPVARKVLKRCLSCCPGSSSGWGWHSGNIG